MDEQLLRIDPSNARYRQHMAEELLGLAGEELALGRKQAAYPKLERSVTILQELLEKEQGNTELHGLLAQAYSKLGEEEAFPAALARYEKVSELLAKIPPDAITDELASLREDAQRKMAQLPSAAR